MFPPFPNLLLANLLPYLPYFAVWGVGLVVALVNWGKHPRISKLAALTFGGWIVFSTARAVFYAWVSLRAMQPSGLPQNYNLVNIIGVVVISLLTAGLWALALRAALIEREPVEPARPAL